MFAAGVNQTLVNVPGPGDRLACPSRERESRPLHRTSRCRDSHEIGARSISQWPLTGSVVAWRFVRESGNSGDPR
jgi:hypothetical protein